MMDGKKTIVLARTVALACAWLLLCALPAMAQGVLKGRVTNQEGKPIELARLVLQSLRDSTKVSEAFTAGDGSYGFASVEAGRYAIRATKVGHQAVEKSVYIFRGKALEVDFVLRDEILLEEVEVRSTGVTTRGDTTVYSVGRFTSGQERNLGDVLERLPGVSVDKKEGTVSVEGKQVSRVLVEGNDLFQGKVSTPLEHMRAEGIRDVSVIDNYSEYDIYDGFRSSGETVINVGMRDGAKGRLAGELLASAGVEGRYKVRNSSMYIGKRAMLSGILAGNNVGERLLSFQDLIGMSGGYSAILSNGDPMESFQKLQKTYAPFMDGGRDTERRDHGLISLNAIANPSPKTKISLGGLLGLDKLKAREEKRYEYLASAMAYDEETLERTKRYNALVNAKLTTNPSERLSLVYSGSFFRGEGKERYLNRLMQTPLSYERSPDALLWCNNLLLVHKLANRRDNISLSLDYNERRGASLLDLNSLRPLYAPALGLAQQYRYRLWDRERYVSAQAFALHRLGRAHFVRVGLQSQYTRQTYRSQLEQSPPLASFDADHQLSVWDTNLSLRLSRDQGSLTYTIGLGGHLMRYAHDLQQAMPRRWQAVLAPSLRLRWAISMLQQFTLSYDYGTDRYDLSSLITEPRLEGYNTIGHGAVDEYHSHKHRASLLYALRLPFSGVSLYGLASLEASDRGIASDLSVSAPIREMRYRLDDGVRSGQISGGVEYRLLGIPLNIRLSGTYAHSDMPTYYGGNRYEVASHLLQVATLVTTHYKRGLNARASLSYGHNSYRGLPTTNKLGTLSYLGQISWQNAKLYASLSASAEHYFAPEDRHHQGYLEAEVRYRLLPKLSLYLQGTDVLHISGREREVSVLDQYYSLRRTIRQMPGSILLGLSMTY